MKGFTILFAILGFCIHHASAAVTRVPIHTTGIEVTADSFLVEKSETHLFDENDYSTPAKEHTEDKTMLNVDLAPRADIDTTRAHREPFWQQLIAVVKCMFEALPGPTFVSEREKAQSVFGFKGLSSNSCEL
ncbi:hypothetical protein VE03_00384 [Pseudogymnoascus sp. 23342-1-I1]|nr:hypothetical protein VE03_00384 [Pseudogymnoascus sp. 23342-1-I1]